MYFLDSQRSEKISLIAELTFLKKKTKSLLAIIDPDISLKWEKIRIN